MGLSCLEVLKWGWESLMGQFFCYFGLVCNKRWGCKKGKGEQGGIYMFAARLYDKLPKTTAISNRATASNIHIPPSSPFPFLLFTVFRVTKLVF